MTTQSEFVVGDDGAATQQVHSPHSAGRTVPVPASEDPIARPRGRAREYPPETAQSQRRHADDAKAGPGSSDSQEVTDSDDSIDVWGLLRDLFTPPDVFTTDRPALTKIWAYAARGEWTGEDGLFRLAGKTYAVLVVVPVTWLAYQLLWIIERPARAAAAAALIFLLAQFGPVHALLT